MRKILFILFIPFGVIYAQNSSEIILDGTKPILRATGFGSVPTIPAFSTNKVSILGHTGATITSNTSVGVFGFSNNSSSKNIGVQGITEGVALETIGLFGQAVPSVGSSYGVKGVSNSSSNSADNMYGGHFLSSASTGINGSVKTYGVYAQTLGAGDVSESYGVYSANYAKSSSIATGIYSSVQSSGTAIETGGYFEAVGSGSGVTKKGIYSRVAGGGTISYRIGIDANVYGAATVKSVAVDALADNTGIGPTYGGYFEATGTGTGAKYGIYAKSSGTGSQYAAVLDGIVGIGTTTPSKAGLVVNQLVGNTSAIFGDNTSGVGIDVAWPGIAFNGYYNGGRKPIISGFVGGMSMDPTTGMIRIYNSSTSGSAGVNITQTDRVFIDNAGEVGIGISNPTATLHVARGAGLNGTAAFAGTTHASHFNYSTAENTYIRGGKDGAKVFINDLANHGSVQVGVAATPTGYKMSIDGKLIATEIDVLVTPWPDYVFKPSYNLRPIKEVEQFIKENGHLPNIPKAEEIENKALSVGNMSKLQMEKIEELTLYMIEMNKRLEALEAENAKLKVELKNIQTKN